MSDRTDSDVSTEGQDDVAAYAGPVPTGHALTYETGKGFAPDGTVVFIARVRCECGHAVQCPAEIGELVLPMAARMHLVEMRLAALEEASAQVS